MIVANLATYPPRRARLAEVVRQIAPQVDRLNIVLNEYAGPVPQLDAYPSVHQIIPPEDLKDTGKFFPEVPSGATVFLIDDDIDFPTDFVERSLARRAELGPGRFLCGYHGSLYHLPVDFQDLRKLVRSAGRNLAEYRTRFTFYRALAAPVVVDQLGSGISFLEAADMPPFSYMKSSRRFVDVRLARWCRTRRMLPVCLPRDATWLRPVRFEETIYHDFTRSNPGRVAREIWCYAFRTPGRGKPPKGWQG